MANSVVLGDAGILKAGKLRWLRALAWMAAVTVLCILAFNVAADSSLRLSALITGVPFTDRAHAPHLARLIAVIVGSVGLLVVYALAVRLGERRAPAEVNVLLLVPDLLMGILIGGALIAIIVGILWSAHWVAVAP